MACPASDARDRLWVTDAPSRAPPVAKKNVTFSLDEELVERMRNACYWIGQGYTPSRIAEESIGRTIDALEKKHNAGQPFKRRRGDLPSGPRS